MKKLNARHLAMSAMLAAVYTVLSLAVAPIGFGSVQFRISEALTLLPVFSPWAIPGVTLGCLLTNLIGVSLGLTFPPDVLFGTLATLIAAVLTWLLRGVRLRGLPVLAALPPVVCNALIIGWEITVFFTPDSPASFAVFTTNALLVGAGEALACFGLGLLLVALLQRSKLDVRLFS